MKISLLQYGIEWLNPQRNLERIDRWISQCSGSQLVILPEMFATGFCMNPEDAADDGSVLRWMQQRAEQYGIAIIGSVATECEGRYYNRLYVVKSDGSYSHYDKRHLFTFAGEDRSYEAGDERVVVELGGVRILLLVCYDIRFPVWSRNRGDYDVIVCVANWPKSRREVWDTLLMARAIENVSYVCGVNIVGEDPMCSYSGGTAVIDYKGRRVATVEDDCEGLATVEIDSEALRDFRVKFPALDDADSFEIKTNK